MKKQALKRYFVVAFLILSMLFTGCGKSSDTQSAGSGDAKKPITIVASTYASPKHGYVISFFTPFMDKVEQKSNGQVKFQRYASAELVPWGGEITALDAGTIDLQLSGLRSYHPDLFPMADVGTLPIMGADAVKLTKAWMELLDSQVKLKDNKTYSDLEITDKGYVALPLSAMDNYVLSTTKKQLKNPEDFKGLILRGGFRPHEMFIKNIGSTPVTMAAGELYDAMSRGTIDGLLFGVADWPSYSFQDILKYTVRGLEIGTYTGENLILKKTWDTYPKEVQDLMMSTAKEQALISAQYWIDKVQPTIDETKAKGAVYVDFKDLPADSQTLLNDAVTKTWTDWIDKVNKQGAPGLECARLWRDLVIKQGCTVPDAVMKL